MTLSYGWIPVSELWHYQADDKQTSQNSNTPRAKSSLLQHVVLSDPTDSTRLMKLD